MSDSSEITSLCERCSLLSFNDLTIGGREVVDKDGYMRLSFEDVRIELRPEYLEDTQDGTPEPPDYRLIRLEWYLNDSIPDMPNLLRSSQSGCAFCNDLRNELKRELDREAGYYNLHEGPLTLTAYLSLVEKGIEGLLVEAAFEREGGIPENYSVEANPAFGHCEKWLGTEPARESSYSDPQTIREMCQVLEHCTNSCHPWISSSFLPTRLIDVGTDSSVVPRIVLSSDISQCKETKYAALSYCWGTKEDSKTQLKTERASLKRICQGIPYETMTLTIQDAILLTRAIGIRYVWIDALCIIQDDTDDWLRESSQMHLVYRHAFVTFCGANSDSCHETLLQRAPVIRVPFQSTVRYDIKGSYSIRRRPISGDWLDRSYLRLGKWGSRAWTLQEAELSTRLLILGDLKMHFKCGASKWSEGEDIITTNSDDRLFDQITRISEGKSSASSLYDSWLGILCSYCGRSLTFQKDRLPALSGLARIIWGELGDQYLAGLWDGDLYRGLCWSSGSQSAIRGLQSYLQYIQQRDYIAPSWSWASSFNIGTSITGPIGTKYVPKSTVVNVYVKTEPHNPFGQVFGGFLQIRGKVAPFPTSFLQAGEHNRWTNVWWHWFNEKGDEECIYVMLDWLSKEKEAGFANLGMFLLLEYQYEEKERAPQPYALVLHSANDLDQYYRVGLVTSSGWEGYEVMKTWFADSRDETICII